MKLERNVEFCDSPAQKMKLRFNTFCKLTCSLSYTKLTGLRNASAVIRKGDSSVAYLHEELQTLEKFRVGARDALDGCEKALEAIGMLSLYVTGKAPINAVARFY